MRPRFTSDNAQNCDRFELDYSQYPASAPISQATPVWVCSFRSSPNGRHPIRDWRRSILDSTASSRETLNDHSLVDASIPPKLTASYQLSNLRRSNKQRNLGSSTTGQSSKDSKVTQDSRHDAPLTNNLRAPYVEIVNQSARNVQRPEEWDPRNLWRSEHPARIEIL